MMPADFIGRYCWLASAVGGAWLWQTPKERETTVESLSMCYVANAKHRSQLPPLDREALEVMFELANVIGATLSKAANRRIIRKINNVRLAMQADSEAPF